MILTAEKLNDIEEGIKLHPKGTHAIFVENKLEGAWMLTGETLLELIRLAKLGLMIEKPIPTATGALLAIIEQERTTKAEQLLSAAKDVSDAFELFLGDDCYCEQGDIYEPPYTCPTHVLIYTLEDALQPFKKDCP